MSHFPSQKIFFENVSMSKKILFCQTCYSPTIYDCASVNVRMNIFLRKE
jgi:hypothetical protein